MEEEEYDSDILIIDQDKEPEEIDDDMRPFDDVQTNKKLTYEGKSMAQKIVHKIPYLTDGRLSKAEDLDIDVHNGYRGLNVTNKIRKECPVHENMYKMNDYRCGRGNINESNAFAINNSNVIRVVDPRTINAMVYEPNRVIDDDNVLKMAAHAETVRRMEENKAAEREVYESDVYESGYTMDDHTQHTNTYRPYITKVFSQKTPNIAHRLPTVPVKQTKGCRPEIDLNIHDDRQAILHKNAYIYAHRPEGPEEVSDIDDYRNAIMNQNSYVRSYKREDALHINDCRHSTVNRNAFYNAHRPEEIGSINDCSFDPKSRSEHSHLHRTKYESGLKDYWHTTTNRNAYSRTHKPEEVVSIGDHIYAPLNVYRHAHRLPSDSMNENDYRLVIENRNRNRYVYAAEDAISIDDYRQALIKRNAYYAHRPEVTLSHDGHRHAKMSRLAYDEAYRPQVTLDVYRSRAELTNLYRPDVVSMDTYRLESELNGIANPETESVSAHNPLIAHFNSYRPDHMNDNNIDRQEDAALNLVRRQEGSSKIGHSKFIVETCKNASSLQTTSNLRKYRIQEPLTVDKNKASNENPGTLTTKPMYIHNNIQSHGTVIESTKYNKAVLSINDNPKAVYMNACQPGVPVRTNRPDTVILSTRAMLEADTSSRQTQTDVPDRENIITDSVHNNTRTAKQCKDIKETILDTSGLVYDKDNSNNKDEATAGVENRNIRDATERKINEKAQVSNVQLLVVFFTRVKDLVIETFPEFAKSLQKEIGNLGKVSKDGKEKTDIQYICPLYCSVSTYSLPRFDNVTEDNKVEKHTNRVDICDVCSCIQNCYKLYKEKYLDLLLKHLDRKGAENKNEDNKGVVSIDLSGDRVKNVTQRDDCDENTTRKEEINEARIDPEHSKIDDDRLQNVSPSLHTETQNNNHTNVTAQTHLMVGEDVEKTIFNELSTLTYNLQNNNKNGIMSTNLKLTNSDDGRENKTINGHLNKSVKNQVTSEKINKTAALKINDKKDSDNKNKMDDHTKDEPKIVFTLSLNQINNANIMSSKLKKIGRKPDSVFTCPICTCLFIYFTSFISHMQKDHNVNGIDNDIPDGCIARKCPFCGMYSKQKHHNDHVRRYHPEIFTHKGEPNKIKMQKEKKKKSNKRKFIFICLVCNEHLMSYEVNSHRESKHKGVNIPKMFTKKLSSPD